MNGQYLRPKTSYALFTECSASTSTFFTTSRSVLSHTILEAEIWFCLIKFSCSINFWTHKASTSRIPFSKMGRVDQSSSFLLLKKLYCPLGMKNRGTRCVAVEREASWCWYSASRAKSLSSIVTPWANFKAAIACNIPQWWWCTDQVEGSSHWLAVRLCAD